MAKWDDIIEKEVRSILLKESKDDDNEGPSPLERLDDALKELQRRDEIFEAIFAPYLVFRDIFKLAITGIKLVLNDVVFVVKKSLAIRPSSWAAAVEGHEKRRAKLMRDWDASMKATGADSTQASLISFLAFPGPMIATAMVDQGFKTVASIHHGLIDSGIRLPLMGLLPGGTPPDEIDMDKEELKRKKRGELTTKDAVKVALMKLFFAHREIPGSLISEYEERYTGMFESEGESQGDSQSTSTPKKIKVTPKAVQKDLEDSGVYDKTQESLSLMMESMFEAVKKFFEDEKPIEKVKSASALLKAKSADEFVKISKTIEDQDMSKSVNEFIKKTNEAAEKVANNKEFQEAFLEKLKKDAGKEDIKIDKDAVKKEAITQVFGKAQPEFTKSMTESIAEYSKWVVESVESIYKVPPKTLAHPIVKASVDKKNALISELIDNISL